MDYKNDIKFDTVEKLKTQIGHHVYFSVGQGKNYYAWIAKNTKSNLVGGTVKPIFLFQGIFV